jgi:hypothetical protein
VDIKYIKSGSIFEFVYSGKPRQYKVITVNFLDAKSSLVPSCFDSTDGKRFPRFAEISRSTAVVVLPYKLV